MTRLHLTWSLERSPVKSRLSRVPWSRSPRAPPIGAFYTGVLLAALSIGFPGREVLALLRSVPSTLAPSLQRSRSVPRPVVFDVQLRSDNSSALLQQTRAQTNQYCNPNPGSPLWVLALGTRSSLSCGRWFLPHWRCPQSALGPVVSPAPSADRCLNPSFLLGAVLPSQALLLH